MAHLPNNTCVHSLYPISIMMDYETLGLELLSC